MLQHDLTIMSQQKQPTSKTSNQTIDLRVLKTHKAHCNKPLRISANKQLLHASLDGPASAATQIKLATNRMPEKMVEQERASKLARHYFIS